MDFFPTWYTFNHEDQFRSSFCKSKNTTGENCIDFVQNCYCCCQADKVLQIFTWQTVLMKLHWLLVYFRVQFKMIYWFGELFTDKQQIISEVFYIHVSLAGHLCSVIMFHWWFPILRWWKKETECFVEWCADSGCLSPWTWDVWTLVPLKKNCWKQIILNLLFLNGLFVFMHF